MISTIILATALLMCACDSGTQNNPVFDAGTVQVPVVEGYIDIENYVTLREARFTGTNVPLKFNYQSSSYLGRVRAAGAGSRNHPQWSYRVTLERGTALPVTPAQWPGVLNLSEFNLNAQVQDRSMMRTALAAELFGRAGFPVFHFHHVFFTLNNDPEGLHLIIERIDPQFFRRRSLPLFELIKVEFGSKFTFRKRNNLRETFDKEYPDDGSFFNLATLIHALDTLPTDRLCDGLAKYLDIDSYLRYHALASIIKSPDNFNNNFYLYKSRPGAAYEVLPWDLDRTFDAGSEINFFGENEIITRLLENDSCFNKYKTELNEAVENNFTEEHFYPLIDSLHALLQGSYVLSPFLGGTGRSIGDEAAQLKKFIRERRIQLQRDLPNFKK